MTSSLPQEIQSVFTNFVTTEFTTIDRVGQPITWPLTPYYHPGDPCIDVTTGLGYPKKADEARVNPKVGMLFSDPTGSGLESSRHAIVLKNVQENPSQAPTAVPMSSVPTSIDRSGVSPAT